MDSQIVLHSPECPGTRLLRGIGVTHEFKPGKHEKPGAYGADPRWNRKRIGKSKKRVDDYEDYDLI